MCATAVWPPCASGVNGWCLPMMRPDDDLPGRMPPGQLPPWGVGQPLRPRGRGFWQRLPASLRRALLWLLWAFGVLALVDMALSILQPGRPMVVATALIDAVVRLGAGGLLGGF